MASISVGEVKQKAQRGLTGPFRRAQKGLAPGVDGRETSESEAVDLSGVWVFVPVVGQRCPTVGIT